MRTTGTRDEREFSIAGEKESYKRMIKEKTIELDAMIGVCFVSQEKNEQCQLCQRLVALSDARNHAAEKHLEATVKCRWST